MTFENFVRGESSAITAGAVFFSVTTEPPFRPPANPVGSSGRLIISDFARSPTRFEIVTYTGAVTAGAVTTLSGVQRGQEGTVDQEWPAGSIVQQDVTAADLKMLELQERRPYAVAGAMDTTIRKMWASGEEAWVNSDAPDDVTCVSIGHDESVAFGCKGGFVGLCSSTGQGVWLSEAHPNGDVVCVRMDANRNVISGSIAAGGFDYIIKKTSPTGNIMWTYTNTTNGAERGAFFDVDRGGCIYVVENDGLRKLSPDGATLMRAARSGGGNGGQVGRDGKLYAVIDSVFRGFNRSLKEEFAYTGTPFIANVRFDVDKDGAIYLIGEFGPTGPGSVGPAIARVMPDGTVAWKVEITGNLHAESEVAVYGEYVFVLGVNFDPSIQVRSAETGDLVGTIGQQFLGKAISLDAWGFAEGAFIRSGGSTTALDFVRHTDISGDHASQSLLMEAGIEPSTPPGGHAWLYTESGSLKVKFANGAVITIASEV